MATGTITNTIKDPSGTAVPGVTVNARLMPGQGFRNVAPFTEVSQLETTTSDSNGDWSLTLEINTDITPGDSYYEIEEQIPVAWGIPSVWAVQVASGSHTLYASLVSTPPAVSVPSYITQSSGDARYAPLGTTGGAGIGNNITLVGTNTVTGTATTAASSTHQHALSPNVVGWGLSLTAGVLSVNSNSMTTTVTIPTVGGIPTVIGTATVTGTSTQYAPADHSHVLGNAVQGPGITLVGGALTAATVGATPTAVGTNTVTGTATQFAPANHGHQLSPAVVGNDLSLSAGVLSVSPRVPTVGASPTTIGTTTVTGTATQYAPANHSHVLDVSVVGNDLSLAAGVLSVNPRVPVVGALPTAVGTNTVTGTATTYAPANHGHQLSPAVVGSGLSLSAGVVSLTIPVPVAGSDTQPTNTGTVTGTATTWAASNHQHPLGSNTVGSGNAIQNAQYVTANATNSNAAASFLYTITSTNTMTATVATGQIRYDTASAAVKLFTKSNVWSTQTKVMAVVAGTITTTTTAFISKGGPSVTILTGPTAIVAVGALASNSGAAGTNLMAVAVTGATTIAAAGGNAYRITSASGGQQYQATFESLITGLTAGLNTFEAQYAVTAGTGSWTVNQLSVQALGD